MEPARFSASIMVLLGTGQNAIGDWIQVMKHARRGAMALLAALVGAGCEKGPEVADAPPPVTWDTAQVVIRHGDDSTHVLVEVSDTDARRSYGLMERHALDPESGMIFTYGAGQPGTSGYWMFRTRIPLDIAFADSAGAIVKILPMLPCVSDLHAEACATYAPGAPYWSALEVNQGFFARHGIAEGDTVRLER